MANKVSQPTIQTWINRSFRTSLVGLALLISTTDTCMYLNIPAKTNTDVRYTFSLLNRLITSGDTVYSIYDIIVMPATKDKD